MTIKELAEKAGVSITAVSFYLNGKKHKLSLQTQEKIQKLITKYNYRPTRSARELRTRRSNIIGIIVHDLRQNFAINLFKGIKNHLSHDDYIFSLLETKLDFEKEAQALRTLLELKANSIVIQASTKMLKHINAILKEFPETNSQIIIVDAKGKNPNISYVYHNSKQIIKQIIEEAKASNIEKIIFLSPDLKLLEVRIKRWEAIAKFAKALGLSVELIKTNNNDLDLSKINNYLSVKKLTNTLIWANNAEIAFNFYIWFYHQKINVNNLNMCAFNRCHFQNISTLPLKTIDTKTRLIALEIANIIAHESVKTVEIFASYYQN